MKYRFAATQFLGARSNQEDFCGVRSNNRVLYLQSNEDTSSAGHGSDHLIAVVCDGMGGHSKGEIASRIAGELFLGTTNLLKLSQSDPKTQLSTACNIANDGIKEFATIMPETMGMGTTLVGIEIEDNMLRWISIGDSRLFLIRGREIIRLNDDHSMRPVLKKMVEEGFLSETEAEFHPDVNSLRSAIMGEEINVVDVPKTPFTIEHNDILILASDGIDILTETEIAKAIRFPFSIGLKQKVKRLLQSIRQKRSKDQDNATILAIRFMFSVNQPLLG